jgi:hypothetical protein
MINEIHVGIEMFLILTGGGIFIYLASLAAVNLLKEMFK